MNEPDSQANEPKSASGDPGSGSIFGNLPKERPGSRSPRRPAGKTAGTKAGAKAPRPKTAKSASPPKPKPAAATPPPPPPSAPKAPRAEAPMHRDDSKQAGGIEDLAWAGVTVAAQAATIGVKLASRAFEAVRKSVDRP